MESWRITLPLGEYSSYPSSGSVYFNDEWKIRAGWTRIGAVRKACVAGGFQETWVNL